MRKTIMIILALVAMNLTDVEAKKFYHYGNTLTFLCDDETMTAEAEAFQSPVTEQATLIVPEGSEQAYRNAEVWKEFKNIATPTSLKSAIVDTKDSERIYDLRGVEQNREKGLVIKNGIKIINN
ncbi:hypothetical protein CIK97_12235 [Prevotella sp. P3-120]|uniref:hypothetical protein n=1 Tax=unclassified Prevotella TaxID=2638335 RepID=UPI000B96E604|nr:MULTISPECIES: hypothetical protein [unclassified Prevotella]OYP47559.1 hypothetical protein CIK97_12235 [Prevotella sp. P3-120]OYP52899.1 hypothetical protein CIK93_01195 [Prevotella sp. P3-92]